MFVNGHRFMLLVCFSLLKKVNNSLKHCVVYCGVFYSRVKHTLLVSLCYRGDFWNKNGGFENKFKKTRAVHHGRFWVLWMFGFNEGNNVCRCRFFCYRANRVFVFFCFFLSYQLSLKVLPLFRSCHCLKTPLYFCKWDTAKIKN